MAFNAQNDLLSVPDTAWVIVNSNPTVASVRVQNGYAIITPLKAGNVQFDAQDPA